MKSFRLSKKHLLSNLIECILVTAWLGMAWLFLAFPDGRFHVASLIFTIPVWLLLGAVWYFWLFRQVFQIVIRDDGIVDFKSWSGCRSVPVADFESIDSVYLSPGTIRVHHTRGTIRLKYSIDGLHEFIWTIKSLNPRLGTFNC